MSQPLTLTLCVSLLLPQELDKLANLPLLLQLNLASNPISRKYGYRQAVVLRCPRLRMFDGTIVTQASLLTSSWAAACFHGDGRPCGVIIA